MDIEISDLIDRHAISDLMTRYATGIDRRDWERWESLFADDVVIDYPTGHYEGRAGLGGWLESRMSAASSTQHFMGRSAIEIHGDSANAITYMQAYHVPDPSDRGSHFDTGGWYETVCVRTEAGWLIRKLRLTWIWSRGEALTSAGISQDLVQGDSGNGN